MMIDINRMNTTTVNRLNQSSVWWKIRKNVKESVAESCRQAITVRNRLGSSNTEGIPLWSEIKSELGIVSDGTRKVIYACHTRANTEIFRDNIKRILGFEGDQSDIKELLCIDSNNSKKESPYYGLVNPFNIDEISNVLGESTDPKLIWQIFDRSILLDAGFPNTVMTNLGNKTEAIEIQPKDLLAATKKFFPNTIINDISQPCHIWSGHSTEHGDKLEWLRFPPPTGPKIGILTGNSPESGLDLWKDILTVFRQVYLERASDVGMPEVLVHSLPAMGLSMELIDREELVWIHMEKAILELLEADCKLITVACNTTIYFEDRISVLCSNYDAEFVSIAKACMPKILSVIKNKPQDHRKIGLIGIGSVIDKSKYSSYRKILENEGVKVHEFLGDELAYIMKRIGPNVDETKAAVQNFSHILKKEFDENEVIVLALTEVSLMYREYKETLKEKYQVSNIIIDPMKELACDIVKKYIISGVRNSPVMQAECIVNLEASIKNKMISIL